jgi:hypothetical protein
VNPGRGFALCDLRRLSIRSCFFLYLWGI